VSAENKKIEELSAEEVLQKFDKESDKRELTGVWGKIISAICILFAFHKKQKDHIRQYKKRLNNIKYKEKTAKVIIFVCN